MSYEKFIQILNYTRQNIADNNIKCYKSATKLALRGNWLIIAVVGTEKKE
jgi:hypothetical protein